MTLFNIDDYTHYFEEKTRVLLYGIHPKITELILFVLEFQGQEIDSVTHLSQELNDNDFILLESNDENIVEKYFPTIIFFGSYQLSEKYAPMMEQITQGGILIYPEYIEAADKSALQTNNFFRKLPYKKPEVIVTSRKTFLKTDFGEVPVNLNEELFLNDVEGAKLLCQQLRIMEDEFFDALSHYQ